MLRRFSLFASCKVSSWFMQVIQKALLSVAHAFISVGSCSPVGHCNVEIFHATGTTAYLFIVSCYRAHILTTRKKFAAISVDLMFDDARFFAMGSGIEPHFFNCEFFPSFFSSDAIPTPFMVLHYIDHFMIEKMGDAYRNF